MSHFIIAPVVLPAVIGGLIILWMRHDMLLQRVFSTAGSVLLLGVSLYLAFHASSGEIFVYRLGNWPAPFGIVLMLDKLAALMLVLGAFLAVVVQLYAIGSGWDRKGWHFHALWQFQMMGVMGAFLTGDAFNLFVFFEVLLIASYGLMIHGGGALRLRAGVQYVIINLMGSTLFLAALGTLYAVTGTLNMADMAVRVAEMPPEDTALLRTGAVLLMLVFAIKAALVPLHFWLPSTYANAPGPVAALFAIMSKVGIYSIIRFYTLVFPGDSVVETIVSDMLLPAALITLVVGQIGVLGGRHMGRVAALSAIASIGTLVIAVSMFTPESISAALYYTMHSTLAAAALFLITDMIAARRNGELWLSLRPKIRDSGLIAALFFATAIAVAGLPPLSGFIGKLLVLEATRDDMWWVGIWTTILVTSLFAIVGFGRAGSTLFWLPFQLQRIEAQAEEEGRPRPEGPIPPKLEPDEHIQDIDDAVSPTLTFVSVGVLLAGLVALTIFARPAMMMADAVSLQLFDQAPYVESVLVNQEGARE
ncbi:monovalent cation/H+ antiporter subunit D [Paracoccus aerodenitrificans]|uniref:monovalent cation/H+ antiporter subunit D n=1 Tax=Paracoccus aerodenitrificans TaxID=3017781 RepID=UPI0022EFE3A1|nr:monovalent cation/H+ antiporter subunit D [Paracoccus aerodenitrificans]WBU63695.1 monovalent cation/H+ antiporter subunit D [Paracoccus aerodenitrificans]